MTLHFTPAAPAKHSLQENRVRPSPDSLSRCIKKKKKRQCVFIPKPPANLQTINQSAAACVCVAGQRPQRGGPLPGASVPAGERQGVSDPAGVPSDCFTAEVLCRLQASLLTLHQLTVQMLPSAAKFGPISWSVSWVLFLGL